ncbi:Hypothetical predicted protein [Paramuricea clavata]|uniref:Uncharacterized protein n=1 Tax=Paramuricea clavata TaxID=317549 RepID=A0A7D9LCJ1_PARCT|nr:Hypothetical predicted protein [Paramuricea clavata]
MISESEAKTVLYKKTAEYLDRGVQRNLEGDVPEPLKPVMPMKPVMPVKPLPLKPLLREEIFKIESHRSTEHDQNEVLRVFFDKPAVPKFKTSNEEEEIEMNNSHLNTNLDNFTSWLKFLQGLGECQDQQFPDKSGHFTTCSGENFKLPPVLIALTHSDEVKGNDEVPDAAMVEDSSNFRRPNETSSEASSSGTAEYLDRGVQRNLEGDVPEPLKPVMPVKPLPVKPLLREEIFKIESHRSTEHDQNEVLRVFFSLVVWSVWADWSEQKDLSSTLYLAVKRGVKRSFVRRELEEKFLCDDAKEHLNSFENLKLNVWVSFQVN